MNSFFLIHGWAMPPAIWQEVRTKLEQQIPAANVVLAELPGYGTTPAVERLLAIDDLTKTLLQQAPPSAHWCGWSLGATLAMQAALDPESDISSLTLVSPTPKFTQSDDWSTGVPQRNFERLERLIARDFFRGWKQFLSWQVSHLEHDSANHWIESTIDRFQSFSLSQSALQSGMDVLVNTDLRNRIRLLHHPTQIVAGRLDTIIPLEASQWLQQRLSNARIHQLEVGHAIPLLASTELANLIAGFSQAVRSKAGKNSAE